MSIRIGRRYPMPLLVWWYFLRDLEASAVCALSEVMDGTHLRLREADNAGWDGRTSMPHDTVSCWCCCWTCGPDGEHPVLKPDELSPVV